MTDTKQTPEEPRAEWEWYAGSNDEYYEIGPCATREAAIEEAVDQWISEDQDEEGNWYCGVHVVEARKDPLKLSDWSGLNWFVDRANEDFANSANLCETDDGPWFDPTKEQEADLIATLKKAIDDWQAKHGLTFECKTFTAARNHDFVRVALPEAEETDQ